MCVCICKHVHTPVHVCKTLCMSVRVYTCMYPCLSAHGSILITYTHVHLFVYMQACCIVSTICCVSCAQIMPAGLCVQGP